MPERWKKLSERTLADYRIFRLNEARFVSPRTALTVDALVLHPPDWVNIVAFTPERSCVMIQQYRFGTDAVTWEIPGGMIDPGESPLTAAVRELREETGYAAARWMQLGSVAPNPAFQSNRLHIFYAEDAVRVGDQEQEGTEDIAVELVPEGELNERIARGEIDHALVVVAFQKLDLWKRGYMPAVSPDSIK